MNKIHIRKDAAIYEGDSFFDEVIMVDYYDGPVSGLACSTIRNSAYVYRAIAWDDWQDNRLYVFAEIEMKEFRDFRNFFLEMGDMRKGKWLASWSLEEGVSAPITAKWQGLETCLLQPDFYCLCLSLVTSIATYPVGSDEIEFVQDSIKKESIWLLDDVLELK